MTTSSVTAPPRPATPQPPGAGSGTNVIRQSWLDSHVEEILDPDLPIVDAHHHVRHTDRVRYLWDELLRDVDSGHNVQASVFIEGASMYRADGPEALRPVGETEFAAGIAAMAASGFYGQARLCAGIVGYADLTLGAAVQPVLEAHLAAAGGRFRGVRMVSNWDREIVTPHREIPPGMLLDPRFRAGFDRLAALGLSYDAIVFHTQLPEVVDLARAYPQTPIVIDHLGMPLLVGSYAARTDAVWADWRRHMQEAARCPNIHLKLCGLGILFFGYQLWERARPPSSLELEALWGDHLRAGIDLFGPDRCMFASNFPVDKTSCSYPVLWNAFKRIAARYSQAERRALFSGTARRFYRI